MLQVTRFAVENGTQGVCTDVKAPRFSYRLEADGRDVTVKKAVLTVNGWTTNACEQTGTAYAGEPLAPFTEYRADLSVTDSRGEEAKASLTFRTGRQDSPWQAQWISDPSYSFTEKKVSPVPMTFRKKLSLAGPVKEAYIYATAIGIYDLLIDGKRVGNRYFAPGFTSYRSHLQYQAYDVTESLRTDSVIDAVVAGGWAVGSFVFTRKNRHDGDRQALLLELRVTYEDGRQEVIGTDGSWLVTEDGNVRMADIYDGETYDATVDLEKTAWKSAAPEKLRISPEITADYGAPVLAHEELKPVFMKKIGEELIYDFGQNFAGVVKLTVRGKKGQKITVRHAEILQPDGSLHTQFLRTAKATYTYICRDGEQTCSPTLTYMGFRYIGISGAGVEDLEVSGIVLYSDLERTGEFHCSNERLNRLQENIIWGAKSNLMDIPTDCPQRDERMGWTGDIAVFGPTACFNFNMSRFLEKWLKDVKAEQNPGGSIPNTVPAQGYGFPATMPPIAVDWWDDACILVPWAEYMARGDESILRTMYPVMKKYLKACLFWAGLFSFGKHRYLWNTPAVLHFGDWVTPDVPKMGQWQARAKWTATASLRNTSMTLSKIAGILGEKKDEAKYREISERVADAYVSLLTDGNGKLKEEFQTAYVLPLYLGMFKGEAQKKAVANLVSLVKAGNYRIGTGFPGTPYILFALADNGEADTAFRMLMNEECPSWLYEVRMGATTIWERWDGINEQGECPIGDDGTDMMISYNHYASGAVGAFLYQRVAGLEATSSGYRTFRVAPLPGGGLTQARAAVETPYGRASSSWTIRDGIFALEVTVPVGTHCDVILPDGEKHSVGSGTYTFQTHMQKEG